jgi:hypothetical protein
MHSQPTHIRNGSASTHEQSGHYSLVCRFHFKFSVAAYLLKAGNVSRRTASKQHRKAAILISNSRLKAAISGFKIVQIHLLGQRRSMSMADA